jgi:hypothetical protein
MEIEAILFLYLVVSDIITNITAATTPQEIKEQNYWNLTATIR